jgi:four helix bundle protein
LTDADSENNETQIWLKFAYECNYLTLEVYLELTEKSKEIGRRLNYMIQNPQKFSIKL